jgi:hypothetical protein
MLQHSSYFERNFIPAFFFRTPVRLFINSLRTQQIQTQHIYVANVHVGQNLLYWMICITNLLIDYARVKTRLSALILNQPSFRIITLIFKLWGWYSVIHCLWNKGRSITASGYCSPWKPLHLTGPIQSGMLVLLRPLTLILPLPVRMGVVHKRV